MVAKIWIWGEESKVVTKPKSIDALATTAAWEKSPSPANGRAANFITGASCCLAGSSNGLPASVSQL